MWEFYTKLNYYIELKQEKLFEYQILTAIALNPHTKKPLNPDKLIPIKGQVKNELTPEQRKQNIENLMRLYRRGKRSEC
jgi:uncharacterized protein YbgA (DUF1722 family)